MADQDNDDFQQNPGEDDIYDAAGDDDMKTSPDEQPPFTPPANTSRKKLPQDDERLDYGNDIQAQESYDEGLTSATEADTWEESANDEEKPVDKI